ncbi:hypothetical protein FE784_04105 [Paenibacillus hemerocallicola]|uniref:Rpn family recombination-promoting nuclease/putative transposase n=1 Tax=Paenibacillus hemerocallicola TaxID=1172614 RepID=A0A5C4TEL7_9BACL|nr:hypothetical protein [Paenibacillus hemerocallicola]TNJ67573.1 hypothetical protein FE784_04105 [Paenibacillus hemerocallicola]
MELKPRRGSEDVGTEGARPQSSCTPKDLEELSNLFGSVFLIEQQSDLKISELVGLFRKLAPAIDRTPAEQREQFAVWLEHILLRLLKTKDKELDVQNIVSDIRKKGLKAVISNLERNLEWIEEQGMLKGFEQGIEKGVEKGIEHEKREIAANMLREGLDATLVAKVTGLSMDTIALLKSKQK